MARHIDEAIASTVIKMLVACSDALGEGSRYSYMSSLMFKVTPPCP